MRGVEAGEIPARSRHCNRLALKRRAESQTPLVTPTGFERDA